jgi:pyruvate ferredoxin oxidoreductase delta subunit/phenylglyoxylate dehydrogenase delta subunit
VATVFTQVNTGSWRIVRPRVSQADCSRCKQCETYCPTAVIQIHGKEEECNPVEINLDYCKGCGVCAEVCPRNCIEMKDEKK